MVLWSRLMASATAAVQTWREHDQAPLIVPEQRYHELWALYAGTAFSDALHRSRHRHSPKLYANTRLLWKHVEGVVDFYATTVYQGDLPTDGQALPDGSVGAIPLDPQAGRPAADQAIRRAVAELWSAWNWRQNMTQRPMYGSALGDVLTEVIDDVDRRMVWPAVIWPGYVADLELDWVGNVKAYALEYQVEQERAAGIVERYQFRKEVTKEEFRYYKNTQPFDAYGEGSVVPNPYGFVPAIWDRHKVVWGDRGASAIDGTRAALAELNSVLSHGIDYQRKAFAAPVIIRGRIARRGQDTVQLRQPPSVKGFDDGSALAESLDMLETAGDGGIEQITFDLGKTLEMLTFIKLGILEENPEASFYHDLRDMSQLTGPAVERALGDAVSRCRRARAGYDAQTIKLFQMATAIAGFRANKGDWGTRAQLTKRQQAFLPFTLDSYGAGALDFGILDRPVVLPTPEERVALIHQKELIETTWGLAEAGLTLDQAAAILGERDALERRETDLVTGFGDDNEGEVA